MNDNQAGRHHKDARQFLNVRHLRGGISAQGMDVNGLIYINLPDPRNSSQHGHASFKNKAGRVSKKELEPGDILVFYGEGLGLYLGGGRFIQIPKKKTRPSLPGFMTKRFVNSLQHGLRIIRRSQPDEKKIPACQNCG